MDERFWVKAWGYSHVKAWGMCHPNGLLFHQKFLDMGPILFKKSFKGGPILQKLQKNVKSAIFEAEKPLEMHLDLQKFRKNCLISRFLSEKNP